MRSESRNRLNAAVVEIFMIPTTGTNGSHLHKQ
jgi:hypothetical protein